MMSPEVRVISNCERPIRQTGWGLYHYFMLGMASVCSFSQATALTSVPFAIPLAICDVSLSMNALIYIDVCYSFGMAIGGFFLSSASDISGRQCMIPLSLMLIFGITFALGFAHGSFMIFACVFTLGCGIAANANCVKIHLAEILPVERRGSCLVFPDLFWTLGYIISAIVSWLLTPSIIQNQNMDMRLATWRLMFGLSGACSIIVACASALLLPSPRYLLYTKKYPEALDTLKHIYAVNNSRHSETYSMRQDDLIGCVDDFSLNNDPEPMNFPDHVITTLKRIYRLTSQLLKRRFIRITCLLAATQIALIFEVLVVNIWLAKMMQYSDKKDCYFTAVDIFHLEEPARECKFTLDAALYRDFFLIALDILIGQFLMFLIIDRIGRRIPIIGGCIACGASSFALGYIHNIYLVQLAISSIFMMAYSLVDSALNVMVIEVYPTAFRGTAAGGTQLIARFASGFMKLFLQTPCQYSFIFIGALMLAAAALSYFLPELRRKPMVE